MSERVPREKTQYAVGKTDDFVEGQGTVIEIAGRSVGIYNVNGNFFAVLNYCPHEGAPVCLGKVRGTTLPVRRVCFQWGREGEILACPWHGWEFDLLSGECLTDRRKLHRFPVQVDEGTVYVTL